MKKLKLLVLVSLILLLPLALSLGQSNNEFKWLHPYPQGNTLRWVKMWDANNWYAVGDGETFMKTTNAGASWEVKNNLIGNDSISYILYDAHFFDMNTGFACGENGSLLKTTNGGETWDITTPTVSTSIWRDMYWKDMTTGFMSGSNNNRVIKTTDGGASWSQVGNPPGGGVIYLSIFAADTNRVICASQFGRVRRTTNAGVNWTEINTGSGMPLLNKIKFLNDTLGYVCGGGGNVRMTTDFGTTWTDMSAGLPNSTFYDINFLTVLSTTYVFITGNNSRIYSAPVGTTSWDTIPFLPTSQTITGAYYSTDISSSGDTLITVGDYGLFNARYSPTNKVSFTNTLKNSNLTDIWAESDTGRVITIGNPPQDQVMYSTNGGSNWQLSDYNLLNNQNLIRIKMLNPMTGYVTGTAGQVGKTTNGGVNWVSKTPSGSTSISYSIFFINENTGWVFEANNNNYKTTNGGDNWTSYNWGGSSSDFATSSYFINENTGWMGSLYGKLYKTTDGGATTTFQYAGIDTLGDNSITQIQMLNANTGWLTANSYGQLRKTTNGGTTWDSINVPFSTDVFSLHFVDQWNGMATGKSGEVFRTRDGGQTWETGNTSGSQTTGVFMTATNRAFICGFNAAIFRYEETVTGNPELTFTNEVPLDYRLDQNYPNPFNPITTIKFGLPRQGLVSLKVYDIAGREIANLINNQAMNAGQVTQRFDGSNLSSGMYFYSLAVDGVLIATKKMVLVK